MTVGTSKPALRLLEGGRAENEADGALVVALQQGDPRASREAWRRFGPYVRRSLRRLLGPGADEDDLSQEVFLRFFDRVRTLREPGAVRSFLFGICLRVVRKELSRRWVRRWLRLTDDGQLPERGPTYLDQDAREAREAVVRYYRILDGLGTEARSIFVTRHIEGLELTEVAGLHGLSVSTTQRRLARAEKRVAAMVNADPALAAFAHAQSEAEEVLEP